MAAPRSGQETRPVKPPQQPSETTLLKKEGNPRNAIRRVKLKPHLILSGASSGKYPYAIERERTLVGRERCDLNIDDFTVSSRHFEVEARGDEYFVRDLDSTNGTLLNGHRIRAAKLFSGDEIRAGRSTLLFQMMEVIPLD